MEKAYVQRSKVRAGPHRLRMPRPTAAMLAHTVALTWPLQNEVIINKYGMIEIKARGDQTVESVQAMGDEAVRLAASLRKAKKRVMVLDNLLEIGDVPLEAAARVAELAKSSAYDKLAMLGSGRVIKIGANLIFHAAGRAKRMHYFDSRTEAIRWLLEP